MCVRAGDAVINIHRKQHAPQTFQGPMDAQLRRTARLVQIGAIRCFVSKKTLALRAPCGQAL